MTLETKLSVDQDYVKSFSEKHQEPAWMSSLRLQALEKAEDYITMITIGCEG